MKQEQARQEADNLKVEYWHLLNNEQLAIQCAIISINREIELLERIIKNTNIISTVFSEIQDLNQIKDELLKM